MTDVSPKISGKAPRSFMLVLLVVLIGLAIFLWQFYENGLPPVLTAELSYTDAYTVGNSWRVPANENFTLRVKANEPTYYTISYGAATQTSAKPLRKFEVTFEAIRGKQKIEVSSVDKAQNAKTYEYDLFGIPLLQPLIRAPRKAKPGYPISVQMIWPPPSYGVTLTSINITLDGQSLDIFATPTDVVALASVPLESDVGSYLLGIDLTDTFGRKVEVERAIEVEADSKTTQQLNLSADLLNLRTPENLQVEEELIKEAYEASQNLLPLWVDPFVFPLEGSFNTTSPFGTPRIYGEFGDFAYHTGLDISAPTGTSVAATNDGIAVIVGYYPIRGGFIMLDHGAGVFSLYLHLETFYISIGNRVNRGQFIGEVGNTGLSNGAHLHWEMRIHNTPTEPLAWVNQIFP